MPEVTTDVTAPWYIAPEDMKSSVEGMRVRELLELRCNRIFDSSNNSDSLLSEEEKCEFQQKLSTLWRDGDGSRSYTEERFYRAGFLAMTTLFAFLFATVFITTTRHSKNEKDPKDPETKELKSTMSLLAHSFRFAMFWVLMRITFLTEQLTIYPEAPRSVFDWLVFDSFIFLVFVALYVYLVIRLWSKSERYEKLLNFASNIASVVIGVMGLLGNFLSVEWIPEVLVRVFGTGGTPLTYIAVLLFLFVVHFPHILRVVEKWGSEGSDRDG